MQPIKLHHGREQSVLRRHPWIFSHAIQSGTDGLTDGDTVLVQDSKGKIIGTGHYQDSSLAFRLLALEEVVTDPDFWQSRLEAAAQCRISLGIPQPGFTNTLRLVHGE